MSTKSAFVAIVGKANVGKSSLLNALLGEKIAIVSNKPQTTRNRICAIVDRGDTQLVFIDTPGFHRPRTKLGDYMVNVVKESVADVDAVILMVDPIANVGEQEQALLDQIRASGAPAMLVINKIDTVEKEALLPVIAAYQQEFDFDAVIPISRIRMTHPSYFFSFTVSTSTLMSNRSLSTSPLISMVSSGVTLTPRQSSSSISMVMVPLASLNRYFSSPRLC